MNNITINKNNWSGEEATILYNENSVSVNGETYKWELAENESEPTYVITDESGLHICTGYIDTDTDEFLVCSGGLYRTSHVNEKHIAVAEVLFNIL